MRFTLFASVALLLVTAQALPATVPVAELDSPNSTLSNLGVSLQHNADSHGPVWNWHNLKFPKIEASLQRFARFLNWKATVNFVDWTTYKANGVNLGAWFEQEKNYDPVWWNTYAPSAPDEWTFCQILADKCGPILEKRYATWVTTADIDKLAKVGVNTLRIPTTYAAWIDVPESEFYHGNQQKYLSTITNYAITKYGMHIIVGLHSLPGGVNSLDIGEGLGHKAWFFNSTNFDYSMQAVDSVLSWMKNSGHLGSFTFAPLNEVSDNLDGFGSATGLTTEGTNWVNTYIKACLAKIAKVDKRIPLMLQDSFQGEQFWSPFYDAGTNMVIDSHVYYFAAAGTYSQYVAPAICGQGSATAGDKKFPVFIGEWSLQTMYNNTLAARKTLFDTQRYSWANYASGGSFWNVKNLNQDKVDGEGSVQNYWDYMSLIDAGVITSATNASYC
ncbi:hypothetical protein VTL71DRAFT_11210 [Oculimacula yallundae]|uniref:glucan 1,3-beta-glucosidase n=1 Tax=Oculimacula yallundae TaxID=86028 RepID=A0ABR4CVB5_9HELO